MNAKEIILIDDDEATLFYNSIVLENSGFTGKISKFQDPKKALDYLLNTPLEKRKKPDFILLDINMPGFDGWDFLDIYKDLNKDLKANELVALLTVSLNPDDREKASAYPDVKDYITKPLSESSIEKLFSHL